MTIETIIAEGAPPAIGPYSHAASANGMLYVSGCLAMDKEANFVGGDATEQATLVLSNLETVLKGSGSAKSNVVKVVIFLEDMKDFADVNKVYASFFGDHKPARSCVAVAQLPLGAKVEIEAIAAL